MPVSLAVTLMLTAYLLVMGYLAAGLWILRRPPEQGIGRPVGRGARRPGAVTARWPGAVCARRGWPGLVRAVAGTALGGYLLLMVVLAGYSRVVARVDGHLLASALTGCAALTGVALPVFFLTSWLTVRRRGERRSGRRPTRSGPR
ncbi:DUF6256 family protein [Sphaerisporangium perillae]|uniref:DUF6256 family protein n=1 Tax=Sphaerisporangium perillae TaxID=2935860 RepID=UPI00200BE0E5|nr:DUF6256 family protein [Sphaerisporangium perillae]